jgi:hypothetical protein
MGRDRGVRWINKSLHHRRASSLTRFARRTQVVSMTRAALILAAAITLIATPARADFAFTDLTRVSLAGVTGTPSQLQIFAISRVAAPLKTTPASPAAHPQSGRSPPLRSHPRPHRAPSCTATDTAALASIQRACRAADLRRRAGLLPGDFPVGRCARCCRVNGEHSWLASA